MTEVNDGKLTVRHFYGFGSSQRRKRSYRYLFKKPPVTSRVEARRIGVSAVAAESA